jgi:hypothetical protein
MSKIARHVLLITTMTAALASLSSSTAGAVTWHNTGSASFHATGGGLSLAITGSGGTNLFTCTSSTATGAAPVGSFATPIYSITGTVTYSPCSVGGTQMNVHCGSTFTGALWTAGTPAVTVGNMDLTCVMRFTGSSTPICHIAGAAPTHYVNPNGATPGRFTLTPGTLTVSPASSSCSLFVGSFTSAAGDMGEQTLTHSSGGPVLTRTA